MENIFEEFSNRIAKYDANYESLFKEFARKASLGGDTSALGRTFETNYEFYMYCFFLGLYNNQYEPTEGRKTDFSHEIKYWGSKNSPGRTNFSILQKYLFAACFTETNDVNLITLEKGDIETKAIVDRLLETLEGYTNGGLLLIKDKKESNPNYFLAKTGFLEFIIE